MSGIPAWAAEEIAHHLEQIQKVFKTAKVTVIARTPGDTDGSMDFVMTDDLLPEVIAVLLRRKHDEDRQRAEVTHG